MNVNISLRFSKIASITGGKKAGRPSSALLDYILLDSRKMVVPATTVFFSINSSAEKTEKIIGELFEKGVTHFVLEHLPVLDKYPGASFLIVNNSLRAIQQIAADHRRSFHHPVIGITGSNGKTIIKEWLNQLLHDNYSIARSPRSYNSQIGVPLSVLQIKTDNNLAIFEAGISEPGEMVHLAKIIDPTIGIFSNIGDAHNEGFKSISEKVSEKLLLFKNCKTIVYCSDYKEIDDQILINLAEGKKLFTWSRKKHATLQITKITKTKKHAAISGIYEGKNIKISIPFIDEAYIENAIHCWSIMLLLKIKNDTVNKLMGELHPVAMRLELKQGINNCSIINDSYSSDIHSFEIALNFLQQQKQHASFTVIMSDILQSGKENEELYREVATHLKHARINRFIGIGPSIAQYKYYFDFIPYTRFYNDVVQFKKDFYILQFHNEAILLKGARVFEFEQISFLLEQKIHQTKLLIDLAAVNHNLKQYKKSLLPDTKIMAMVKAFSYGSGAFEIARVLQYNKVDYLAVAYTDEGITLRNSGITMPIMIMNPEENSFDAIVQYFLEPEIFSFALLEKFEKFIDRQGLEQYPVHIKVDTGMHRLGFLPDEIPLLGKKLLQNKLHIQSAFTHLIASNNYLKSELTLRQFELFKQCCFILETELGYQVIKHIANTSAISMYPQMQMNMVRAGIGIYGIDSNTEMQKKLKNVTTLTTTIAQIKNVKKGETVGYGADFVLSRNSKIATIRIGYADGYHRVFGNGVGKVMIHNILYPVIGNVCMDMTMIDITGSEHINEGDSVEIFGNSLPLPLLAKWSGTIAYEIMTNISQRVNRVYFEE